MNPVRHVASAAGTAGPLAVMASQRWTTLVRYVRRRVRTRIAARDTDEVTADVQVELAERLAAGTAIASLHRLADRVVGKCVERWYRRRDRWATDVDPDELASEADYEPGDGDSPPVAAAPRHPSLEAMTAWWLLRGAVERAVVRAVWDGAALATVTEASGRSAREIRRVLAELPAKLARRRRGGSPADRARWWD